VELLYLLKIERCKLILDLLEDMNWFQAYDEFVQTDECLHYIEHQMDYYLAHNEEGQDNAREYFSNLPDGDIGDVLNEDNDDEDDQGSNLMDDPVVDVDDDAENDENTFDMDHGDTHISNIPHYLDTIQTLVNRSTCPVGVDLPPFDKKRVKRQLDQCIPVASVETDSNNVNVADIQFPQCIPTRVSMLTNASNHSTWVPPPKHLKDVPLPAFPTLLQVSQCFQLGMKQHYIFNAVGQKLISALKYQEGTNEELPSQVISFLQGPAGYGKSQVIRALLHFAEMWGCTNSIRTAAFQGVAAASCKGTTIHSLFGFGKDTKSIPTYHFAKKLLFASLKVLILDEFGMIGQHMLGLIDCALRELMGNDKPFGGVQVMFVGDWLQLSPVGQRPGYRSPKIPDYTRYNKKKKSKKSEIDSINYLNMVNFVL
jgi:hypothetical protein